MDDYWDDYWDYNGDIIIDMGIIVYIYIYIYDFSNLFACSYDFQCIFQSYPRFFQCSYRYILMI